jgi:DNA-binding CsgD family transcriptional regulator
VSGIEQVAAGPNAAEIAERLDLSRRTVEMHRLRAMRRLGVHSSTELTEVIVEGRAAGLID